MDTTINTYSITDLSLAKFIVLKGASLDRYGNQWFTIGYIVWAINVIAFFKSLNSSASDLSKAFGVRFGYGLKMAYDYLKKGNTLKDLFIFASNTWLSKDKTVWSDTWKDAVKQAIQTKVATPTRYTRDNPYEDNYKGSMKVRSNKNTWRRAGRA